jgi:hypothetical protein
MTKAQSKTLNIRKMYLRTAVNDEPLVFSLAFDATKVAKVIQYSPAFGFLAGRSFPNHYETAAANISNNGDDTAATETHTIPSLQVAGQPLADEVKCCLMIVQNPKVGKCTSYLLAARPLTTNKKGDNFNEFVTDVTNKVCKESHGEMVLLNV